MTNVFDFYPIYFLRESLSALDYFFLNSITFLQATMAFANVLCVPVKALKLVGLVFGINPKAFEYVIMMYYFTEHS